jgi:hypothetical protein
MGLQIFKIRVPDRVKFGYTLTREFILPNRIKSITGITANVVPDKFSRFKKENNIIRNLNLGSLSVSLNNTDTIFTSIPVFCTAKTETKTSISQNTVQLAEPYELKNGGQKMRFVFEEVLRTPFVKAGDPNYDQYFNNGEIASNSYEIKIYIHHK